MGAPKGNKYWQIRNKHGRDKLFKDPQELWLAACDYFQWCDDNPLMEEKLFHHKGDITRDSVPRKRPYLLRGLCIFLDCSPSYFREFKRQNKGKGKGFLTVIKKIEEIIHSQKFEGAVSGFFNSNIIARDLGLTDKKEVTYKIDLENFNYDALNDEEKEQLISLLEKGKIK